MSNSTNSNVAVYACGGAGINTCSPFIKATPQAVVYGLDTSIANFKSSAFTAESRYLFKDKDGLELDGSGGAQDTNFSAIKNQMANVVHGFKPKKYNIVAFSCAGGSGAAIALALTEKLLSEDKMVVLVALFDDSSRRYAQNSQNVLKNFSSIAKKVEKPIVMGLVHNQNRKESDKAIQTKIAELLGLFSNTNLEMDSKDIELWLNFDKKHAKEYQADLYLLETFEKQISKEDLGNSVEAVVCATLAKKDKVENTTLFKDDTLINHQTLGFIPDDSHMKLDLIHFVILSGAVYVVFKQLDNKLSDAKEAVKSKAIGVGQNINNNSDELSFD